jgi:hypothetical protein
MGLRMARLIRWLRRWQQRDDQHLVKRADPIEALRQAVGEAQQRDIDEERQLYPMFSSSYRRRRVSRR